MIKRGGNKPRFVRELIVVALFCGTTALPAGAQSPPLVLTSPITGAPVAVSPIAVSPVAVSPVAVSPVGVAPMNKSGALIDDAGAKASVEWLVGHALQVMPRKFDGDKDWGDTKKVWSGVKMRMEGLQLKTNRRFREVDHGRWIKYEVTLPDLKAARTIEVSVDDVASIVDPTTGQQRWRIDASIVAPMEFSARVQRWNFGVKLYSVTVSGIMEVRMNTTATIGIYPDYGKIPPDIVVDPRIENATLNLQRFEVERVSHIGGDAAEAWGEIMQEVLVERFVKAQDDKLVSKLNKSINKERDALRISMSDWLAKLTSGTP